MKFQEFPYDWEKDAKQPPTTNTTTDTTDAETPSKLGAKTRQKKSAVSLNARWVPTGKVACTALEEVETPYEGSVCDGQAEAESTVEVEAIA